VPQLLDPLLRFRRHYLPVRRWARAVGLAAPAVIPPPPDPLAALLPRLFRDPAVRAPGDLGDWLCGLPTTAGYRELVAALNDRGDLRSITGADEVATLALLVGRLRPELTLEIGTFFAGTTRVVAEAAVAAGAGRVMTLDPFGGHRVPGILAGWPAAVRERVEFRPDTSMCYFAKLDLPRGGRSPLGLAFVDGNHAFEYALFDVIRAADHLTPGGAVVVDNMDQDGPRQAAVQFLDWNPAWRLFAGGRVYRSGGPVDLADRPVGWGVLVAPAGVQVAGPALKSFEHDVPYQPIRAVRFHVREASGPGTLAVKLNYHAYPRDFSVTGRGLVIDLRTGSVEVDGPGAAVVGFDPPAALPLPAGKPVVVREMEVTFTPAGDGRGHVLLDADRPFAFD
jgi:predicted O-methyltransferase YrrM